MDITLSRALGCLIIVVMFLIITEISFIKWRRVHNNFPLRKVEDRKGLKQCFRLSLKTNSLGEIRNITVAFDGNTSTRDSGLLKFGGLEKSNKKDFISCSQFVTLSEYMGQMGNQMFETASVFGLAYKYDAIPVIPSWLPLRTYFELPNVADTKHDELVNVVNCEMEKAAEFYNCSKEFSSKANISVHGFRQSWKYFADISEIIRTVFTFKSRHILNAKSFLSSVSNEEYQRVCIHVRRGDHTLNSEKQAGRLMADRDYIQRAKKFFIEKYKKVQFIVVSDDKEWCRRNLNNVTISPLSDAGDEMALMMLSDHVIVTVGTYGWWGAWLSGGTVVYLKTFARPGSTFESMIVVEDYIPNTWIAIE